jgi:hypothetical protein
MPAQGGKAVHAESRASPGGTGMTTGGFSEIVFGLGSGRLPPLHCWRVPSGSKLGPNRRPSLHDRFGFESRPARFVRACCTSVPTADMPLSMCQVRPLMHCTREAGAVRRVRDRAPRERAAIDNWGVRLIRCSAPRIVNKCERNEWGLRVRPIQLDSVCLQIIQERL